LFDGQSLFQINYQILLKRFKPEEIYIQTTSQQVKTALKQAPGVPQKNCFVEPELRNHGPAMGLMAVKLSETDPDEPFILVQVDVIREPAEKFLETIDLCESQIKKEGKLMTGGIRPEFAVMGVDYLIADKAVSVPGKIKIFKMDKWLWRGSKEEVEKYLSLKSIFLHANHYAWTPRALLEAYKKWAPDWYAGLEKISSALGTARETKVIKKEYSKMEKGPVENVTQYALKEGGIIELPFSWIDFGTWESFFGYRLEKKKYLPGQNLLAIDSKGCFVQKEEKNFVALIGVEDLIVVDTNDALLVCRKDQTGRVGEIVAHLREKGKKEYL